MIDINKLKESQSVLSRQLEIGGLIHMRDTTTMKAHKTALDLLEQVLSTKMPEKREVEKHDGHDHDDTLCFEGMSKGDLKPTEFHPAAQSAMDFMNNLTLEEKVSFLESFSSCAIEGNRLAEVCAETLNRYMEGQKLSDRYLLGLAWTIRNIKDGEK